MDIEETLKIEEKKKNGRMDKWMDEWMATWKDGCNVNPEFANI